MSAIGKSRYWWSLICGLSLVFVLAQSQDSRAIDPTRLQQQFQLDEDGGRQHTDESNRRTAQPPSGNVRERDEGVRERHADLHQEGAPAFHPPWPRQRHWMLGVRCWYLETGARVTYVYRNTPAWRVGLEPRDIIISIDGYQIGYVNRRFYEISDELNLRAGRTGRVRLLVQNCRNNQLVNVDVQLARIGSGFPRERFNIAPEEGVDQADTEARDRAGGTRGTKQVESP